MRLSGGGCQFLGTAATSQVVGEALGLSLPHAALAPSGHAIWLGHGAALGTCSAGACRAWLDHARDSHRRCAENAMVVHAAFGGSTNLIL